MSKLRSRFTVILGLAALPVVTPSALAQQADATNDQRSDTMDQGPQIFGGSIAAVGLGGNFATPCSRSPYLRLAFTPYCLSDAELGEERRRVMAIIHGQAPVVEGSQTRPAATARPAPQPRVPVVAPGEVDRDKLVPPPTAKAIGTPRQAVQAGEFREEPNPSRRERSARQSGPSRDRPFASRPEQRRNRTPRSAPQAVDGPATSGAVGAAPSASGKPDRGSGGRAPDIRR